MDIERIMYSAHSTVDDGIFIFDYSNWAKKACDEGEGNVEGQYPFPAEAKESDPMDE